MHDNFSKLNSEQKNAVTCTDGPVMIIAGPGSGKTRVITERIAYLIQLGIPAQNILALTFTNKAAKEMKSRIHRITENANAFSIWMGTFHSIFSKILRKEAHRIKYTQYFTIYDNDDSVKIIRRIIKDLNLDKDIYNAKSVFARISFMKNNLIDSQKYNNENELIKQDLINKREEFKTIYEKYCNECHKSNAMDFDDLLIKTHELFKQNKNILEHYQSIFKYILIDEYQDTNKAQDTIIKQIGRQHQNVCIVGDDSQSIYSFRGANINNMLNFKMFYTNVKEFKLEQNYRSTKNIVNAANSLIAKNKNKIEKTIFTENKNGTKIKILKYINDREEGDQISDIISKNIVKNNTKPSKYAVLYRTNSQSKVIEDGLRKRGINYKIFGGLSFYQRKEIKDVMAYLKLIVNNNDNESLIRIINYPTRGIGPTTLDRIRKISEQEGQSIWKTLNSPLIEDINVQKKTRSRLTDFVHMMNQLLQLTDNNVFEIIEELIALTEIIHKLKEDPTDENINRVNNIGELVNSMKMFSERKNNNTLLDFINEVSLDETKDNEKTSEDYVSLMTIHQSKGLEFPHVYIVGLETGLFPSQKSIQEPKLVEEERRLFYVAITRAINEVVISHATNRFRFGTITQSEKSFFIDEINPLFIEELTYNRGTDFLHNKKQEWKKRKTPPQLKNRNLRKITTGMSHIMNLNINQKIIHNIFGEGTIKKIDNSNGNQKITVLFVKNGEKVLLTKFAKFKIIS
ncbi:MAG: ATP-dependent DNA helicase [Flavobacteriales bacterium]|nr:ATP-dependent DNA helicase [Flavobacteriales bacterium]